MTPAELDAIEARAKAATTGPWYVVHTDDDASMNAIYVGTRDRGPRHDHEQGMADGKRSEEVVACTLLQAPRLIDHAEQRWDEDAAFIAAAREDVPALVAEVRRLTALVAATRDAALEEAAQRCDEKAQAAALANACADGVNEAFRWQERAAKDCAALVRAMKGGST